MFTEPLELAAETLEYVLVPWDMTVSGVAVDPVAGSYTPVMAFTSPGGRPAAGDWKAADWEQADGSWHARCLVGPGGTATLAAGTYDPWVRVTGPTAEVPVKRAPGRVRVV